MMEAGENTRGAGRGAFEAGWFLGLALACVGLYGIVLALGGAACRLPGFVTAGGLLGAVFLIGYTARRNLDIFDPAWGSIALVFLYALGSALYVERRGLTNYEELVDARVLATYYLAVLLGLTGLMTGLLLGVGRAPPPPRAHTWLGEENRVAARRLAYSAVLLGVPLFAYYAPAFDWSGVAGYASQAYAVRVERMADAGAGLREVLLKDLPVTLWLGAAVLWLFGRQRPWMMPVGAAILLAYIVTQIFSGWRSKAVWALLFPIVFFHYRCRRFGRWAIGLGAGAVFLFATGMEHARAASDWRGMWDVLRDVLTLQGVAFLSPDESGELQTATNLMRLIAGCQAGETTLNWGTSVVSDLLVFVPRAFFAARPLPLSEQYMETFYPGVRETGAGYGFYILQEGYWAFGLAGVFAFMLAYGWVLARVYRWFAQRWHLDVAVLCYSSLYAALVVSAVRSGVMISLKTALMHALPFLLVRLLPIPQWRLRRRPASDGVRNPS